ncbi:hypothetical protein SAMN02910263_00299 [Butyrivibrio sp. INlla16]|nr:hypothetical protein SAMN02910263_00299 [Butyrivibrio sp. INlla16]
MSLSKLGENKDNVSDYLNTYGKYITEAEDIIVENVSITYCKKCGGQIDRTTRKCLSCGKQYVCPNRVVIAIFRCSYMLPAILYISFENASSTVRR